jgi:hypothetical protein
VLSPDAIDHRAFSDSPNPKDENINARLHWSALEKLGRAGIAFGKADRPYTPPNLHLPIPPEQIAAKTPEEENIWSARS